MKYLVIDKINNIEKPFNTLQEVARAYNMPYSRVCRIYRKDFPDNKRLRTRKLLESFDIVDIDLINTPNIENNQ